MYNAKILFQSGWTEGATSPGRKPGKLASEFQ